MECLHVMEIAFSNSEVHAEHCEKCKKDFVYPIDYRGEFDRQRYANDHKRDHLQPHEPLFQQEFKEDKYICQNIGV